MMENTLLVAWRSWYERNEITHNKAEDGSAGTGMILRDARGSIIFSACRSLESCDGALQAELCACLEGLELSLQHSQLPVIVESDCSQLVAVVCDNVEDRLAYMHIIYEIKLLCFSNRECNIVKVD
jgi:ribonuclease HI